MENKGMYFYTNYICTCLKNILWSIRKESNREAIINYKIIEKFVKLKLTSFRILYLSVEGI
jgi:hypothetical protein